MYKLARVTILSCVLIASSSLNADVWVAGDYRMAKISTNGQALVVLDSVFGRRFAYSTGIQDFIGVDQRKGSVWVSDVNNNRVFQLNSNGQPLREITLFSPFGIGIDQNSGAVWTSILLDEITFPRAVIKLDPDTGEELVRVTGFSGFVSSIAVGASGQVWIADRFNNEVVVLFGTDEELGGYDASASSGYNHLRLSGYDEPLDIDISRNNGSKEGESAWIADRNNREAVKLGSDGTEFVRKNPTGFFELRFVSVNSQDGSVWVGDPNSGRVAKLSALGEEAQNLSIGPTALAADVADDTVWVGTGFRSEARVLKLDSNGTELLSVSGLGTVRGIASILEPDRVNIDIKPGSDKNYINPCSRGRLRVAILTTENFDAGLVDPNTIQFGPCSAEPIKYMLQDIDYDGDQDLVLKFETKETGVSCCATEATLTGQTLLGNRIIGTDFIKARGCKKL